MNVIDSKSVERDAGGKPVFTFPHPAPDTSKQGDMRDGMLAHNLEQAAYADSNIEIWIDEDPSDFRDMTCGAKKRKDHK